MRAFTKGQQLESLTKSAITREQLARYAKASLDPNKIHLDDEVAKNVGLPGVIAHGMLTMAFMGEFLYQTIINARPNRYHLKSMKCRFKAMVFLGDVITVSGTVRQITEGGEIECEVEARNQRGEITATGHGLLLPE